MKNHGFDELVGRVGTILQRYKTGDEKVTDTLSDQTILWFIASHL